MESKNERALIEQMKLMNKNLTNLTKAVKGLNEKPPLMEIIQEFSENFPMEKVLEDLKKIIKGKVDKPL